MRISIKSKPNSIEWDIKVSLYANIVTVIVRFDNGSKIEKVFYNQNKQAKRFIDRVKREAK